MCGLAGIAGNGIIKQDVKIFKDLLHMASLRGEDSTGVLVSNTHKPKGHTFFATQKEATPSPVFIKKHGRHGHILQETPGGANLYMGHARWGTVGDFTVKNAHPFETNKLIGMHNGTLVDFDYAWDKEGRTDSELMFEDMSKRGILPVLEGLDTLSAFAVSIFDKKSRKLYLARNKHRKLYVGFNKKAGVMYWSSEFYMLYAAVDRNDVDIEAFVLKPDILYTIDIDAIKMGVTVPWTCDDIKYKPKKVEWKPKLNVSQYSAGDGWYQDVTGVWRNHFAE